MSERGPAIEYEIVWKSGHIERIHAHQVTHRGRRFDIFEDPTSPSSERIEFHGEFDGLWQLVLSAAADDIATVRNITQTEAEL